MFETGTFTSMNNKLAYAFTAPRNGIETGIIFVHAADGSRLGPHRMFVEYAQLLTTLGYATFRFDMRGCGDSEGRPAGKSIEPDIEDCLNAIRFFSSYCIARTILLLGISRGARVILSLLANHKIPIEGAILLSTPFSSPKAAAQTLNNRLKEYILKLKEPQSLIKLLSGKANIPQISKTLGLAWKSQRRYKQPPIQVFESTCPLLFIYGQRDPIATSAKQYYSQLCDQHAISHTIIDIANANHSFFHYQWKEQIYNHIINWLNNPAIEGRKAYACASR